MELDEVQLTAYVDKGEVVKPVLFQFICFLMILTTSSNAFLNQQSQREHLTLMRCRQRTILN